MATPVNRFSTAFRLTLLGAVATMYMGCSSTSSRDSTPQYLKESESRAYQQSVDQQIKAVESRVSQIPDPTS